MLAKYIFSRKIVLYVLILLVLRIQLSIQSTYMQHVQLLAYIHAIRAYTSIYSVIYMHV